MNLSVIRARARQLASGYAEYVTTWRGAALAALLAAFVLSVSDAPLGLRTAAAAVTVIILGALLSAAARAGSAASADPEPAVITASTPKRLGPADSMAPRRSKDDSAPEVSVIVPFFNDERFVEQCLQSVINQGYRRWELIAVDDCGTDGSARLVSAMAQKDPRIRLVRHDRNRGLAAARNTGLALSSARLVTFLDGDDFLFPDGLSSRIHSLPSDPSVAGTFCSTTMVPEEAALDSPRGKPGGHQTVDLLVAAGENPFIASAPVVRRDVVLSVSGFNESFTTAEDFDLWTRILRQGFTFIGVPVVGVAYRQKRTSMISDRPADHARVAQQIYSYLDAPLTAADVAANAPAPFMKALQAHQSDARWLGRLSVFATLSVGAEQEEQLSQLLELVPSDVHPSMLRSGGRIEHQIERALNRYALKTGDVAPENHERIRSAVTAALHDTIRQRQVSPPHGTLPPLDTSAVATRARAETVAGRPTPAPDAPTDDDPPTIVVLRNPPPLRLRAVGEEALGGRAIVTVDAGVRISEAAETALRERFSSVTFLRARRHSSETQLLDLALLATNASGYRLVADELPSEQTPVEHRRPAAAATNDETVLLLSDGPAQAEVLAAAAQRLHEAGLSTLILDLGALAEPGVFTPDDQPQLNLGEFASGLGSVKAALTPAPYGGYLVYLIRALLDAGIEVLALHQTPQVHYLGQGMAPELETTDLDTVVDRLDRCTPKAFTTTQAAGVIESWVDLNRAEAQVSQNKARLMTGRPMREFADRHAGQRCFILGNGPSLTKLDLSKLSGEVTFGVNGIFLAEDQMGYPTTYYVVEDTIYMQENIPEIVAYEAGHKFFPTDYRKYFDTDLPNVSFFEMDTRFYGSNSPQFRSPRFSTDFSLRGYSGQSVTIINLQLAYYMGFADVYLIGMDFNYVIPESFIRDGHKITSTDDDPNHFHPDYFGKGKTWKDPQLDCVLASYQMAHRAYAAGGRRILNATLGGKLEEFPRVDFDGLFG